LNKFLNSFLQQVCFQTNLKFLLIHPSYHGWDVMLW
jgi:hypothetical protein